MNNILVTGGAGFIGSNLINKLLVDNRIVCIDDLSSGTINNISKFMQNKNFKFIEQKIEKKIDLTEKIDQIYNLACNATIYYCHKRPMDILSVNSIGMKNVLDFCVKNDAKLVHASTSEIYGDPKVHPQKESYLGNVNLIGPRACYDEGKRFAETMVSCYNEKYNLNSKMMRIFNTYGPKMSINDIRVIPSFIKNALTEKPLVINGSGLQTRSFCYVSDLTDGAIRLMNSKYSGALNIGNDYEISINLLAEKIINLTKSNSKIIHNQKLKDDPHIRKPDLCLIKKELNWVPKISLDKGLKKTINWFNPKI